MSSPISSEIKGPNFPATDPNPTTQYEEQQPQQKEDQNPKKSPNSITLEIPDAVADDPNPDDAEEITPSSPAGSDFRESSSTFSLTFSRRVGGGGGKRRKRHALQEKKYLRRYESLSARLNLIPFVPVKSLDLSSNEALLRRLGLWDFAHLDFDFKLRRDLILQLIANFSPGIRYSKVNEVRIKVTRPDLGRALCLPVKKGKVESASEEKESEESVSFVEEFVSNFILLHDDTWMMSDDVMSTMKLIREGNFEKIDFAALIWTMVEKELNNAELGDCYYASHLQLLIKSQKVGLLMEEEPNKMQIDLKEEDQEVEAEEEEGLKMSQELHGKPDFEEQNIELSLAGMDNAVKDDGVKENQEQEQLDDEEDAMDFEESKEVEVEERQWYNNSMDGNFLQQCNLGGVGSAEFQEIKEEEEEDDDDDREDEEEEEENDEEEGKEGEYEEKEEEEDEMAFGISPKGFAVEGMDSENLIEAIEASQNPFSSALESRNFFVPKVDNMPAVPGGSGLFNIGNGSKRPIGDFDDEMPHNSSLNGGNKRMRSDEHWDNMKSASEHDIYMDQIQHILGKARMVHNAKDQELQTLSVQNQMLHNELENQANIYQHNLAKAKMEEHHKRQVEMYRYEHELHMMGKLLEGYRKALKDTTRAFAEYRKKVSLREEPIYKDAGSGGLVLSTTDMEKLRLKREEEERQNRLLIERMVNEFEGGCVAKLEEYKTVVELMSNRLLDVEKGVNFCKEKVEKSKGSLISGCAPSEEQGTQTTV